MTLYEQFEQVHGFPHYEDYTVYVEWLEDQIELREQAAWNAAMDMVCRMDEQLPCPYKSIEEWRKSCQT